MPAEGSGSGGREGLALLRTAISREWLVLIALISGAEAKPAVHRPRWAPRPWGKRDKGSLCKTPEASSHSGGAGCLGREPGSPETGVGGAPPGWLTPLCPEPAACPQSSQHIFK